MHTTTGACVRAVDGVEGALCEAGEAVQGETRGERTQQGSQQFQRQVQQRKCLSTVRRGGGGV